MEVREPGARYLVRREFKLTEAGSIPADWTSSTVGAEFHIQLGKMLDAEKNTGELKPFLGNRAVQWGRVDTADLGEIRLTPDDLQRFRLREGDLLVCEGGEVGRAAIWTAPIAECYYQKALHRLRARRGFNSALMLNLLRHMSASGRLQNYVTQTSIAHLPKDKFETIPLPVPATTAEQAAIADALSDADSLIESLEQLLAKKRQIKQGAMQELLTGQRRLPGFSGAWTSRKLGQHASFRTGPFGSALHKSDYVSGGIPVINPMQIIDGTLAPTASMAISEAAASGLSEFRLQSGDIVIGRRGEMGRCAVASNEQEGWLCGTGSMIVRVNEVLDNRFIQRLLSSSAVVAAIESTSVGTTMINLNQRTLSGLVLNLPPQRAEQTAIATTLSDMDAEISALDARLAKARQLKQGMAQALLTGRIRLV